MKGLCAHILRVNLTTGDLTREPLSEERYRLHLGGRGLIAPLLLSEIPRGADPFGPENRLVFALGALTGHPFVGSGRNSVGCQSPLSGGFGEAEAGGYWGAELRRAGFEAIVVEGASPTPVCLWIRDGVAELRPAGHLWGLETAAAEAALREELGDRRIRTALIGPAGERRVRYACILNDVTHAAGRSGMGAVMGAKGLKGIAVRGSRPPAVADRERLQALNRWMHENFRGISRHWQYGTGSDMDEYEAVGNLPVRNFRGGRFPGVDKISAKTLCATHLERMETCFGCPIRCKRVVRLAEPYPVDPAYGGPEYETLAALGSNCGVDDLAAIMKANELCNRYGIDTISTGVAISFAMECTEQGLLTTADTDGLALRFGNGEAMLRMVEKIARREGFGDLLAEGCLRAARRIGRGAEALAMQVKGEEIPMHEPRSKQAMGLHYSLHATGADHGTGIHDMAPLDEGSGETLYQKALHAQLVNYLGLCRFPPWKAEQVREAFAAVTGWPATAQELVRAVDRGITLARIFNLREGFSARDDVLPARFEETPAEGPLRGLDPDLLDAGRLAYYRMLGWDREGIPTREGLEALGIGWAADALPTKAGTPSPPRC